MSRKKRSLTSWGGLMPLDMAMRIVGGLLSNTKKMPGYSYNLPASACIIGVRLQAILGSVCDKCYALRGHYTYPVVQKAMQRHLEAIYHPDWVYAMATMINWWCQAIPFFRWHDSGDLQGVQHLKHINEIARLTPIVRHWIPTREVKMVRTCFSNYEIAPNLCVRISEPMIQERTLQGSCLRSHTHTSGVAPRRSKRAWRILVEQNTNQIFHCPAILQDGRCEMCRACWQQELKHVVYPQK